MDGKSMISVRLTLEQWNIVGVALDELPRKHSNEVYGLIASQIAEQTNAPEDAPKTPAPDDKT